MRKNRICTLGVILGSITLLWGCTSTKQEAITVSGARSAVSSIHLVLHSSQFTMRPGPTLGTYVTLYLAQGAFLRSHTALDGISAQQKIIAGQVNNMSDEVYALLSSLGDLLQTNISDILDRSPDRSASLDSYVDSLRATAVAADRKKNELIALLDQQENSERDQRRTSRELDSTIRDALRNEDFHSAAALQEEAAQAKTALADIETKKDQTETILKSYKDLLEIATDRLNAIQKNRDALVAGVKVTDVPGIEDLNILEKVRRSRTIREETLFEAN